MQGFGKLCHNSLDFTTSCCSDSAAVDDKPPHSWRLDAFISVLKYSFSAFAAGLLSLLACISNCRGGQLLGSGGRSVTAVQAQSASWLLCATCVGISSNWTLHLSLFLPSYAKLLLRVCCLWETSRDSSGLAASAEPELCLYGLCTF